MKQWKKILELIVSIRIKIKIPKKYQLYTITWYVVN